MLLWVYEHRSKISSYRIVRMPLKGIYDNDINDKSPVICPICDARGSAGSLDLRVGLHLHDGPAVDVRGLELPPHAFAFMNYLLTSSSCPWQSWATTSCVRHPS
jgi:hypothetical protein